MQYMASPSTGLSKTRAWKSFQKCFFLSPSHSSNWFCSFLLYKIYWNYYPNEIPYSVFFMPAHQKSFLFISYLTDYYSHGHQSCSFPTKSSTWYHDNAFPPKIHISSSLSLAPNFQWCITSSRINIRIPSTDEFELAHFYFSKIISKFSIHT